MNRLFILILCMSLASFAVLAAETDGPVTAINDPRLKTFATQKRQQTEEMAAKLHLDVPPEIREFFRAAEAGDWNAVSNSYARIQRLTSQTPSSITMPGYTNILSVPVHETLGAYDEFHRFNEPMLQKFADGVLHSIPSGSIYFGGTDPGRFIITAVRDTAASPDIFVLTQKFVITQNALADNRYTDYLRLVYGERLSMPTTNDVQEVFQKYADDIRARQNRGEPIGAGEQVRVDADHIVHLGGPENVMAVNGILTKWIFDHNKDKHEFYVEESYVIPWMFPYMEPHGLILKLNKEPMKELGPAVVTQDRQFWDTLIRELLADPKFLGNDWVRGHYAKLRASIGGLYVYRRLTTEAEAVFKQAQELCPTSPEASFYLAQLYMQAGRLDDAIAALKSFQQRVPSDRHIQDAIDQLEKAKQPRGDLEHPEK